MKPLQKFALFIAVISLFASCQSASSPREVLSNKETRKVIMDTIANNSEMTREMMEAMMNNKNSMVTIQGNEKFAMMSMENHAMMMKMMKSNPGMMDSMMADMMEACKNDPAMMNGMCKSMMQNKPMMDMMHKMEGEKMDMNKMEGMKHKM